MFFQNEQRSVIVLTPHGRDIPPSVLNGDVEIVGSPELFVEKLRAGVTSHGAVNLEGELPDVKYLPRTDYYLRAEKIFACRGLLVDRFNGWHLEIEDDFFWLRREHSLEHSIALAELLLEWRRAYVELEEHNLESELRKSSQGNFVARKRQEAIARLKPVGQKIYPQLPPVLKKTALRAWGALNGRGF